MTLGLYALDSALCFHAHEFLPKANIAVMLAKPLTLSSKVTQQ